MAARENMLDILRPGDVIKDKWRILRMIGKGGFGQIFETEYIKSEEKAAMKVESCQLSRQVLKMEVAVLKALQYNSSYVCKFYGCGREEKFNYIIMSLLGKSITTLRKERPLEYFSTSTALRLGIEMLVAIRDLHDVGFIHRDIKPSNFALGVGNRSRRIFMYDFGLSRQFQDDDGQLRQARDRPCPFRGTPRYASINAHNGMELGRHDDLWSLFYLLIELTYGRLPWKKLKGKNEVGAKKRKFNHNRFFDKERIPNELKPFLEHLWKLDYYSKPNYELILDNLKSALKKRNIQKHDPYDWEMQKPAK